MLYVLILLSSLASAAGNYLFLGGLEDQKSYILALSISSSIAGFLAYGVLPQVIDGWHPKKLSVNFTILALICSGIIGLLLSTSSAIIFLMIFAYINGEIILSRSGDWGKIHICRIAMLATGFLSWSLVDQYSILLRGIFIITLIGYMQLTRTPAPRKLKPVKEKRRLFILLVLTNLFWVYVTPLIIVFDASDQQAFLVYLISSVSPLVYFKAQDVIFKVEIIGPTSKQENSGNGFLLMFAMPLASAYVIAVPLSAFNVLSSSLTHTVLFSGLSILLLSTNFLLTRTLSNHSKED